MEKTGYRNYNITEDLFLKVKEYINSLKDQELFDRSGLFKAIYGEEQWVKEACKVGRPLDILIHMLVVVTPFVRATIWSGIWIKSAEITSELTLEDLVSTFEKQTEEDD